MSDKRAIYAIGTIVAAFALVFGMVAGSTSLTTMSVTSQDPMQMSGHVIITLADSDGYIKAYRQTDNEVVLNGQDCAADKLFGNTGSALCASGANPNDFIFIGIGTGLAGGVDISDTKLGHEILTRTGALDSQLAATTTTGAIKTIVGVFILGSAATVDEVGLFDSDTTGSNNMFSHLEIDPVIAGGLDDKITITYEVTVG